MWLLWPLMVYQIGLGAICGLITWGSLAEGMRWSGSSFPELKVARITFQYAFAGFAGVVTMGLVVAVAVSVYGLLHVARDLGGLTPCRSPL